MKNLRLVILSLFMAALAVLNPAHAETANSMDAEARTALHLLVSTTPAAADLAGRAKAVLIFPSIVKAGFIFGGAYGEGVMQKNGDVVGHYNSVTASWGLQIGAQSYGYVVFLMSADALNYVDDSNGWELGTGPTIVVVNEGAAKNLSTSTLQEDAYAFIFDQQGLMVGLNLEGTKITRIH